MYVAFLSNVGLAAVPVPVAFAAAIAAAEAIAAAFSLAASVSLPAFLAAAHILYPRRSPHFPSGR